MKHKVNEDSFKIYAKEDRLKAKIKWTSNSVLFPVGSEVTLVGEFTINAANEGTKKQYIFTNGVSTDTMHEGHFEIIPKEKLELGDFVHITWCDGDVEQYKVVFNTFEYNGYLLDNIRGGHAFDGCNRSTEQLLKEMKRSSVVKSYEILPKSDYELVREIKKKYAKDGR